ncbi:MAG: hypothetical protein WCX28_04175 [Bacteriovoracaceae bacterium]|nr:hypothetical protein [Bacteroidota bacterium]
MPESIQFFTTGHLNEYGVSLVVDAVRLNRMDELPKKIVRHIEGCDQCKEQILQVTDLTVQQSLDQSTPHPYFDTHKKRSEFPIMWYRAAAVLAVALAGGITYYLLNQQQTSHQIDFTVHPPAIESTQTRTEDFFTATQNNLYADNFVPSPNLDDVIQSDFRSATIEVFSPNNGEFVHPPITFRWEHFDRPMKLKILTNKEITILTSIVTTNSFITTKKFEPGLYYWKLEADDELLYIGNFFVR